MPPTPRPFALLAELTYRCPLKCPYCSNPLELSGFRNELDTATWKRVLGEAAALGVVQVHFSGGEPLVRADLCALVAHARTLDLYTNLSTGGTLADVQTLQRLRDAGLDALQISVQDVREAENDWLAGTRSFDKKCRALAVARQLDFAITLNVVVHRHNLDHALEIIDWAAGQRVERLELAHVQYTGWGFRNRAGLLPTRAQVERAAEIVAQARREHAGLDIVYVLPDYFQPYPKACLHGWGRVFLTVAPDGAVLPCQTARDIAGLEFPKVQDASLEDIWFHAPVFERFRGTSWLPEPCQSCTRRDIDFGGCRCQAFLLTGDASATDPVCELSPAHGLIELQLRQPASADLVFRTFSS
jgi:pyrroloquinoline quinone biosynthesis protein E